MEVADVMLWGSRIGVVAVGNDSPVPHFQYDKAFLDFGIQVAPLVMPLASSDYAFPELARSETFKGLPGLLADSLPDKFGNAVLDAWLADQGRTQDSLTAIERLCYTGTRGMGALEYKPALMGDEAPPEVLRVDALAELAEAVLAFRKDASARLTPGMKNFSSILKVGSSVGGARAKAVIGWNKTTNEVRSGQVPLPPGFGYWLIKFDGLASNGDRDGDDPAGYGRVEYAYHLMAMAAGIDMTECRLWEDRHFMTLRFDRRPDGRKLHVQSLGAIGHLDFNEPRRHSYEQAFAVIRRIVPGAQSLEQLFRRMVFNVLAWNCDDHVKNISFLMDPSGVWSLAPAYDLSFAYNSSPNAWTCAHQMAVNGKFSGISDEDLLHCSRGANLSARKARSLLGEVREAVRHWRDFADRAHVSPQKADAIAAMLAPGTK